MNASANEPSYGGPEQEIFKHAFSDPIIENEMLYPALTTLDDIYNANATLLMPVEHFFTAYENLQIESVETLELDGGATHLLHVTYTLGGATYHGYAYAPAAPAYRPAGLAHHSGERSELLRADLPQRSGELPRRHHRRAGRRLHELHLHQAQRGLLGVSQRRGEGQRSPSS